MHPIYRIADVENEVWNICRPRFAVSQAKYYMLSMNMPASVGDAQRTQLQCCRKKCIGVVSTLLLEEELRFSNSNQQWNIMEYPYLSTRSVMQKRDGFNATF